MADVAGLSHAALMTTARNYLRLETLHTVNDAMSNAIATLPAFHLYDIRDSMHSSSDGQRMETQIETINARYSPKYFGLKQGVSAYTLVANHVPINAKIIGTHEHESHYVFDLLYNNTSTIPTVCLGGCGSFATTPQTLVFQSPVLSCPVISIFQTPPDLVVKFQPIDIVDVILRLVLRPRVVYQREIKG
jgi:hypothetical protein